MKNSFRFFLIIVCLVLFVFISGCTEDNVRDSIGLDSSFQEVYDAFMAEDEDLVFTEGGFSLSHLKMRAYGGFFTHDLIRGDSFEDVLAADGVKEYYITYFNDHTRMIRPKGETWEYLFNCDTMGYPLCWLEAFWKDPLCFFEKSTKSAIPESVTVKSAYFLMESVNYKHYVFYRTNQGNFVLYIDGYKEDADLYLLPEDIFYDKIQECKILSGDVYGPNYRITADFSDWKLDMR